MPHVDFFARLGVFVDESFFDAGTCRRIRAELRAGSVTPRKIVRDGVELIDDSFRKSGSVLVDPRTSAYVEERFRALTPALERFFDIPLPEHERPYFGAYKPGDFFRPHADSSHHPDAPAVVRARRITAIVFLNEAGADARDDSYTGGSLVFYGLVDDPAWKQFGFPVAVEAGTLIAFRAHVVHEVEPITDGVRYTVVSRYCAAVREPSREAVS